MYNLQQGEIVPARGPKNFGWDPVFQPEGFDKTLVFVDVSRLKICMYHIKYYLSSLFKREPIPQKYCCCCT